MKKQSFRTILPSRLPVRLVIAVCMCITASFGMEVTGATQGTTSQNQTGQIVDENEEFDVAAKDGYIYIYSARRTSIQIYTILGQLIVRQDVQQGTTRIKAPSRGVYILRAGSITRRVTVN